MIQSAEEPIETTRDLASIQMEYDAVPDKPIVKIISVDEKFEIIKNIVLIHYNLEWNEVNVVSRKTNLKNARFMIMNMALTHTTITTKGLAAKFIGQAKGTKDHSTVINARNKINDLIEFDKALKNDYNQISNAIELTLNNYEQRNSK